MSQSRAQTNPSIGNPRAPEMKLAVLSDVHGNVPALQAVLEDIERWGAQDVIANGDLINRGPDSLGVLEILDSRPELCRPIQGNHEAYVRHCAEEAEAADPQDYDLVRFTTWTSRQIGVTRLAQVAAWPPHRELTDPTGRTSVHVTHGSRLGHRDGVHPELSDTELHAKVGTGQDVFVASHTHRPLVRSFQGGLVVNSGSVGQPLDGDPRASYARLTFHDGRWEATIARVRYDQDQAAQDFFTTGFVWQGGPIARLIYRELRESRAHLGPWRRAHLRAVLAGRYSVATSVAAYEASLDTGPDDPVDRELQRGRLAGPRSAGPGPDP